MIDLRDTIPQHHSRPYEPKRGLAKLKHISVSIPPSHRSNQGPLYLHKAIAATKIQRYTAELDAVDLVLVELDDLVVFTVLVVLDFELVGAVLLFVLVESVLGAPATCVFQYETSAASASASWAYASRFAKKSNFWSIAESEKTPVWDVKSLAG